MVFLLYYHFIQVFSECTEAITTSLIPLVTNFPEICNGFSFTVWTKVWPLLAHYSTDGVLAHAILNFPHPTIPPINLKKVAKGSAKKYGN